MGAGDRFDGEDFSLSCLWPEEDTMSEDRNERSLVLMAEFCLATFSFLTLFIASMYLAMAVGHLFSRHRRLISVAAFIVLYILLVNAYSRVFSYGFVQSLMNMTNTNAYNSMLTASAIMLIPAALFLAAVCWILEHKLNLE